MLMIRAAKLHIVCLERNLGAKMYYLSFKSIDFEDCRYSL